MSYATSTRSDHCHNSVFMHVVEGSGKRSPKMTVVCAADQTGIWCVSCADGKSTHCDRLYS